MNSQSKTNHTNNSLSIWRFWIPLWFQTAIIISVPAQALHTMIFGKTVILQTVPVSPHDSLEGYAQMLRYDISKQENLRQLKGWEQLPKQQINQHDGSKLTLIKPGTRFYVILAAPVKSSSTELPSAWFPVALSMEIPSQLIANQVAIKGLAQKRFIDYNLENYFMSEQQWQEIDVELRQAMSAQPNQLQAQPPIVMEIKVNSRGHAIPVSIRALVGKAKQQQIRTYRL
ncbi:MAG: GDYXXLXY domain-containing protein [Symploca sp. SIO2B6]|nr:GDYXXLXY domain-containing protein [Symploca sp. SIO2B6]